MRRQSNLLYPLCAGGFLTCFASLLSVSRSEFGILLTLYTALFVFFIALIRFPLRQQVPVFILCAAASLFFTPQLSNDYYRFLWDGELLTRGINPYDLRPAELVNLHAQPGIFRELYGGMSELSKVNYSCYTPGNQLFFTLAAWPSDSAFTGQLILKLLFTGLLLCTVRPLQRLFNALGIAPQRAGLFLLNPLVLTEVIGNLHFEGVMTVCLLLFLYYLLVRKSYFPAILFLALAVQTKLLPLILLPFLLRYLGWKKSLLAGILVLILNVVFFGMLIDRANLPNFRESLQLYFGQFEFNSSIVHWLVEKDWRRVGWLRLKYYAATLSEWSAIIITGIAVYGGRSSEKTFLTRIFLGLACYFLLSPVAHPWYLVTFIAFGIFTDSALAICWSYLVFLSYAFYNENSSWPAEALRTIEYLALFSFAFIEFLLCRVKHRFLLDRLFA